MKELLNASRGECFKISKYFRITIILIVALIVIISSPIVSSAEEGLGITNWLVESKLLENGDLSIVEDITFSFNKKYNGVFREIVLEDTSGIEGIRVVENNKDKVLEYKKVEKANKGDLDVFVVNEENNSVVVQIFSPSNDEEKTFRIIYTVKNVAKKYRDIGELYYKFLGSENDTPIEFFSVNMILSKNDTENKVKFFAHGPLNGKIKKTSDNTIHLGVENVPKDTYVEGRILFPREFIPNSQNVINKDGYLDIINEEAILEQKIQEDIIKRKARGTLFGNIALVLAMMEIIILIILFIKYRRPKDIHAQKNYLEVPEDNTPAVVSYITSAVISSTTIISTILDLYRKGYVKVDNVQDFKKSEEIFNDFNIIKVKKEDLHLLSHEKHFISWLIDTMGDGVSVTTKDIENFSKKNSAMFTKQYTKWIEFVKADAKDKGYFAEHTKKYGFSLVGLFPIGLILSILSLVYENLLGLFLIFTSILMLIQGIMLLSRKSEYGYDQYRKWVAFKKYMKDLKKNDSLKNLDRYPKDITLIYGLVFGINMEILNRFNIEPINREDTFSYGWMYWYFLFNNNRNNAFNQSINNSFSSGTTSVGGGGGFTAGGGGGAGGGGAGGF